MDIIGYSRRRVNKWHYLVVAQFESLSVSVRHPQPRRSSVAGQISPRHDFQGDPSLRLKSGSAQDDATLDTSN
jgi:hypothetical protein